jgi:hypothetical protein
MVRAARRIHLQRRFLMPAALATFILAVCVSACSGEGEGQRCDLHDDPGGSDNSQGTSDCASGLRCYPPGSLGATATAFAGADNLIDPNFGVCCPYNLDLATTAICQTQRIPTGADAAAPVDAGEPGDSAGIVPPADASPVAPADAGPDLG